MLLKIEGIRNVFIHSRLYLQWKKCYEEYLFRLLLTYVDVDVLIRRER